MAKSKLDREINITKEGVSIKNYSVKDIMLLGELIMVINAGGATIEKSEEDPEPGKVGFETGHLEEAVKK